MLITVKPLSVNQAWQGRRFATKEYKEYERFCLYLLPKAYLIPSDKIQLNLTFGLSNKSADLDNCCKPWIDILQKKYNFDDKNIYKLIVEKKIVPKKQEYIEFSMEEFKE